VKSISAGHKESNPYRNGVGSYVTKNEQSRAIELTLRAIGVDQPSPVSVQIWWIGQVFGTTKMIVLRKETISKNVSNGTPQVWQSESGEVKSQDRNLRLLHYRKQTGSRVAGWLVQADGDSIHSVVASESNLHDLAGTDALKAMEKAAEEK
jgi:hypothetical protein